MNKLILYSLFFFVIHSFNENESITAPPSGLNPEFYNDSTVMAEEKYIEELYVSFLTGKSHNHPSFVFWIEDIEGNYIQTLFITAYVGSGTFRYADAGNFKWKNEQGESIRPSSLPYWSHKRNIISRDSIYVPVPENKVPDAYSGATPNGDFRKSIKLPTVLPEKFRVLFEINQTWDWNEHWTNDKYPDDEDYMSSCQPSLIYGVVVNKNDLSGMYHLNPLGHGHYSGDNGILYTDISTLTTAMHIVEDIVVEYKTSEK